MIIYNLYIGNSLESENPLLGVNYSEIFLYVETFKDTLSNG